MYKNSSFNSILRPKKRVSRNVRVYASNIQQFNDFVVVVDLCDVSIIGKIVSWISLNGECRNCLDIFLLTRDLIDLWKVKRQRVGSRKILDHSWILLDKNYKEWGPKPFKFFNFWMEENNFRQLVNQV